MKVKTSSKQPSNVLGPCFQWMMRVECFKYIDDPPTLRVFVLTTVILPPGVIYSLYGSAQVLHTGPGMWFVAACYGAATDFCCWLRVWSVFVFVPPVVRATPNINKLLINRHRAAATSS